MADERGKEELEPAEQRVHVACGQTCHGKGPCARAAATSMSALLPLAMAQAGYVRQEHGHHEGQRALVCRGGERAEHDGSASPCDKLHVGPLDAPSIKAPTRSVTPHVMKTLKKVINK
jgi:hypothetical protein